MNHTPLPWRIMNTGTHQGLVVSENGENVAVTYNGDDDAEFIATACNCHDELLKAAQAAYACLRRPDSERNENRVVNILNATIAQATT